MEIKSFEELKNIYEFENIDEADYQTLIKAIENGLISYDDETNKLEFKIKNQVRIFKKDMPENVLRFRQFMAGDRRLLVKFGEDNAGEAIYQLIEKITNINSKDFNEKVTNKECEVCENIVQLFLE